MMPMRCRCPAHSPDGPTTPHTPPCCRAICANRLWTRTCSGLRTRAAVPLGRRRRQCHCGMMLPGGPRPPRNLILRNSITSEMPKNSTVPCGQESKANMCPIPPIGRKRISGRIGRSCSRNGIKGLARGAGQARGINATPYCTIPAALQHRVQEMVVFQKWR
jgi:hypothetical protein